jgi:hypothetical protein
MIKGLKVLTTSRDFLKGILGELVSKINIDFKKKSSRKKSRIKSIARNAILSSPEMLALSGGELGIDLGIPANQNPAPLIAEAVASSLVIDDPSFRVSGSKISGNIKINIQPNNFSNLLNQSFAYVATENGQSLPWLSWLLEEGDSVIVFDWSVEYGPFGRSGGGHMVEGGAFTINPQYSGTQDDNFISRSLDNVAQKIIDIYME